MPPSEAKLAASRSNGTLSRGPSSIAGKARSSVNSTKHGLAGLCAAKALIPGEDAEEFAAFRASLWAALNPADGVEAILAERVIASGWRLRRALRVEAEVLDRAGEQRRRAHIIKNTIGKLDHEVGWAFEATPVSTLDCLARYESRLERSLLRNLHELDRRRAGLCAVAIDADVGVTGMMAADATDELVDAGFVQQKPVDNVIDLTFADMRLGRGR